MPPPLPLTSLDPRAGYCVLRDPQLHESIVVSGRTVQTQYQVSRDFKHFEAEALVPHDYVKVDCGDFVIAIWRDPTRPELNIPYELAETELPNGAAPETTETTATPTPIAEEPLTPALERLLRRASRAAFTSLYVQS